MSPRRPLLLSVWMFPVDEWFSKIDGSATHGSILRGLLDISPEVRRAADWAATEQKFDEARTVIEKMLETEKEKDVAISFASVLSQFGKSQSVRPLIHALQQWLDDPEVACQIIEALSIWNTPEVETAMKQFLKSAALRAHKSSDSENNEFYLSDTAPAAGVEGAIRWAIRNDRKSMNEFIAPFKACSSLRHQALAQAVEYYLR
jgi:hypothetical protein